MSRFTTKSTGTTTNTFGLNLWLIVKAGLVKRTRVISYYARSILARMTGQVAVSSVAVCADPAALRRHGHARRQETLALLHAGLGWRPVRRGSGGASQV